MEERKDGEKNILTLKTLRERRSFQRNKKNSHNFLSIFFFWTKLEWREKWGFEILTLEERESAGQLGGKMLKIAMMISQKWKLD